MLLPLEEIVQEVAHQEVDQLALEIQQVQEETSCWIQKMHKQLTLKATNF